MIFDFFLTRCLEDLKGVRGGILDRRESLEFFVWIEKDGGNDVLGLVWRLRSYF